MTQHEERVLSWSNVELRMASHSSFREPIKGSPDAELFFDAYRNELGISIESASGRLPAVEPSLVSIELVQGLKQSLVIRNIDSSLSREFYDFIVAVLDGVQLQGVEPSRAIDAAWSSWVRLLDQKSILSDEKQIGLLGELWLLTRISTTIGWQRALESWHDIATSEHDFCIHNFDLEVKTTASEDREHIIGSLHQLAPNPARQLFVLSIQLTRAARLSSGSFSLAEMITSVSRSLEPLNILEAFEHRLSTAGCKIEHIRHFGRPYLLRSAPRLIPVDEHFPRLTNVELARLGGPIATRIRDVQYRINVEGLGVEDGSREFLQLIP